MDATGASALSSASLARLADIELPPVPNEALTMETIGLGAIVALLCLGAVFWIYAHRRRSAPRRASAMDITPRDALRTLDALQQGWNNGKIDGREAAYRIATLLRLGLGVVQLRDGPARVPDADSAQWHRLTLRLNTLRYRRDTTPGLEEWMFDTCRQWLRSAEAAATEK